MVKISNSEDFTPSEEPTGLRCARGTVAGGAAMAAGGFAYDYAADLGINLTGATIVATRVSGSNGYYGSLVLDAATVANRKIKVYDNAGEVTTGDLSAETFFVEIFWRRA